MKKYFLLISFFVLLKPCFAQDSTAILKKYTYLCYFIYKGLRHEGSCFFYRKGAKNYMVSNYHILSGVNTAEGTQDAVDDTIIVVYSTHEVYKNEHFKIPVHIPADLTKFYSKPDIYAVEINEPPQAHLNYINEAIDAGYTHKIPETIFSYGYPATDQSTTRQRESLFKGPYVPVTKAGLFGTGIGDSGPDSTGNKKMERYYQLLTMAIKRYYFMIPVATEPGRSGSPVFGKFFDGNKTVYKFAGVMVGGVQREGANVSLALTAPVVMQYLETLP